MILIDSTYIHDGGGKSVLKSIVESILKIKKMEKNKGIKIDGSWYYNKRNNVDYSEMNELKNCGDFKKLMFNRIYN